MSDDSQEVAPAFSTYVPSWEKAAEVWEQLSAAQQRQRYDQAGQRLLLLQRAAAQGAESERWRAEAVGVNRSNYRRWQGRYAAHGFDGLLSLRWPPRREMPQAIREAICVFRQADAAFPVVQIVGYLQKHQGYECSSTVVKRVLREAGLAKPPGPARREKDGKAKRAGAAQQAEQQGKPVALSYGGMVLLQAASEATGCLAALTETVLQTVAGVATLGEAAPIDREGRDAQGRFEAAYNDRYRMKEGAVVGPGFASVSEKREGLCQERLHVAMAGRQVVSRKLWALMCSPLLGEGGWDGLRTARGEQLGELCGYPYMPSTLDLFVRELKYVGVAAVLWETHAKLWLKQTAQWGEAGRAVVLYVDGTTKGIWTALPSHQTSVSHLGRIMPGMDVVSFHSGHGTPLWMMSQSGRAPLTKVVPDCLRQLDRWLDQPQTARLIVIDAEGCAVPFLAALEQGEPPRGWVTLITPWLLRGKSITWQQATMPYRQQDTLREGAVSLNHNPHKTSLPIRLIELRRSNGECIYLGASCLLDPATWPGEALADLYFGRYVHQEMWFRHLSQSTAFKRVHGYGKRLVSNITVVQAQTQLARREHLAQERLEARHIALAQCDARLAELAATDAALHTKLDALACAPQALPKAPEALSAICASQHNVATALSHCHAAQTQTIAARLKAERDLLRTSTQLDRLAQKHHALAGKDVILQHDTEADSLFNLLKVSLLLLIRYVLKEFLGNCPMAPETFLHRFATLPATLTHTPTHDILHVAHNRRDPELMTLLRKQQDAINAKQLALPSGKRLRITVQPPPPPRRPPPQPPPDPTQRSNSS